MKTIRACAFAILAGAGCSGPGTTACGSVGLACCTTGTACDEGRCGSDGVCLRCGADGLACCAEGNPCDTALRCGWRHVCGPSDCGGGGEPCCTTGDACWDQPSAGMTSYACYRGSCTGCDPRYGCIWNTCGNGECDGLLTGETCDTCPDDCGCAHGQSCSGLWCHWSSIDGKVVDAETGAPLAGVRVIAAVRYSPTVLTGADGSFVVNVSPVDHVSVVTAIVDGGVTHLTVFEDVRAPVTLPIASPRSTPTNAATLEVSVSGGEAVPAATTTTLGFFASPESSGAAVDEAATQQSVSGPLPAPWTLTETWAGAPSIVGRLDVLQVTETGAAFWGADYSLTLSSGEATTAEVTLAPLTAGTIAGTYASPADFSPAGARQVVWLGSNAWHGPTDVQAFVPGEPGRFGVPANFATDGPTSALCLELDDLLVAGGTSETCVCPSASADALALPVDHASTLLGPADGAAAFDPMATAVTFQAPSSDFDGYFVVTFDASSSSAPLVVDVYTSLTSVKMPDLSMLSLMLPSGTPKFDLPPGTPVTWSVTSRGPKPLYQDVSTTADTQDWRVTLPQWGCPGGTAQSTRSQSRMFTTPAVSQ